MNALEQETLADGFRVALLGVEREAGGAVWRYGWRLFDGGTLIDRGQITASQSPGGDGDFAALLRLVLRVVAPPHVLVCFGRGWRELLAQSLDRARAAELRLLDLTGAARALAGARGGTNSLDAIIHAYGIGGPHSDDGLVDDRHEALLWSVVSRAGAAGLDWPHLLNLTEETRAVSFDGYAFDAHTIASLPNRPGVYVMSDRDGQVLYVGKSGDVRRRLGEYFRPTVELPAKIAAIRQRIHHFTVEAVGSELEALLVEHHRIETLMPALNVQRQVAEARGRYGSPAWPRLVVLPSVADVRAVTAPDAETDLVPPPPAQTVELFGFGEAPTAHAYQVRVLLSRPPRATLAALCGRLNGSAPALRRTRAIRDWGVSGNAICSRFFGAHADRLHGCEIPPGLPDAAYLDTLLAVIRRAAETGFDPAEIRFA